MPIPRALTRYVVARFPPRAADFVSGASECRCSRTVAVYAMVLNDAVAAMMSAAPVSINGVDGVFERRADYAR